MTEYAELAVTTNFSFLRGASHPKELVRFADRIGLAAIGIADRNSFAGVVRAYDEWLKRQKIRENSKGRYKTQLTKLIVGTRLVTADGLEIIAYPTDRDAYGRLCQLLTKGNLKAEKGQCHLTFEDILPASEGQIFIVLPPEDLSPEFSDRLVRLAQIAPGRTYLAGVHRYRGDERRRLGLLSDLGLRTGTPLVAVNDIHYHSRRRRALADVVTCIRETCTIAEAGLRLTINAERHLKTPKEMARLFAAYPEAIARTVKIAKACNFSLDQLKYEYPDEPVPPGKTAQGHLEDLTWEGAERRYPRSHYPEGPPREVVERLHNELAVIEKLKYAHYFLTVHDVVRHARDVLKILCQGRGSAANSAVCYCLGITEVNPNESKLLFARFISERRNEPPDIDVDFEHERREEVIQYIYRRYTRDRAAICATVIHYRARRAIREVGKALGLTPDVTAALAKTIWGFGEELPDNYIRQAGLDPGNPVIRQAVDLATKLVGFPRHLSQHVGGFVLTRKNLDVTVPISNASMKDRTVIEWDKDDIDTVGLMKVDVLALGMLTCLRRALDFIKHDYGKDYSLATLPAPDKETYDMISSADTVGVFQVESRAQMSMLPRLKPQCFYDLVIEVAIVRPGPIQGDMVHPYLTRRDALKRGIEPHYPSPHPDHGDKDELREVLSRTLGVPLFQEQAMQIAITAAKFTPDEADGLRRAMATFRHNGNVHEFRGQFINGMTRRGYDLAFAENCFSQIEGFGEYGFPESHAASFALLVYASAWIKCHYPDVFCAAILNSQPMGFYQPAQLVRDARQHDVEVRGVDVNDSAWDCTLEPGKDWKRCAVRLGFNQVKGLNEDELKLLISARGNGYSSIERLAAVAGVSRFTIERLAEADAFRSLNLDRRAALWAARRLDAIGIRRGTPFRKPTVTTEEALPLFLPHMGEELFPEPKVALPEMVLSEQVVEDYVATGLSLKQHPVSFFRERLKRLGVVTNAEHRADGMRNNQIVTVAGLVLIRQMPGTAKGVVFATLEDETDIANIIVWRKVFEQNRRVVMTSRFLAVQGRLQRAGLVVHVVAEKFLDLTPELHTLRDDPPGTPVPINPSLHDDMTLIKSRDFH